MIPALKREWVDTPQQHYDLLHAEAHGTVLVWEKALSSSSKNWHKIQPGDTHASALLSLQQGQKDRFISVNEFFGWRLVRLLKELRACYVDIDGCTSLEMALEMLSDAQLPPPTMAVFSGRGIHLYWVHDPVPKQALPVWQRCQDALIKALKPLGADAAAKDCTRVLRLTGSVNSKSSTAVRGVVFDEQPWNFRDLCNEVLGYRKPGGKAKVYDLATMQAHRGNRLRTGSIYDRWHLVYQDLLTIGRWYDFGGIPEGSRNNWLFLSAVSLSWFANPETLREELTKTAKVWTPHLSDSEVAAAIKAPLDRAFMSAEKQLVEWNGQLLDPRFRFKRETLFEWMAPIIPEELAPKLRAIVSDETKKEHKKETDGKRWKVSRTEYEANSAAQTKPWEALGMSRATYYRKKSGGLL